MSPNPAVLTWPRPVAASGGGAAYIGIVGSTADATSYTFADTPIGAASADRVLILAVHMRTHTALTVTVGGISATKINETTGVELWQVAVPTGATADIVLTSTTTAVVCAVAVWAITGYTVTFRSNAVSKAPDSSHSVTTSAGGCLISAAYVAYSNTRTTYSGVTEDYDQYFAPYGVAGGHTYPTAAETVTVRANSNLRIAYVDLGLS